MSMRLSSHAPDEQLKDRSAPIPVMDSIVIGEKICEEVSGVFGRFAFSSAWL
jgi:hypothetical protein